MKRNYNVWAQAAYIACILLNRSTNILIKPQKGPVSAFNKDALQLKDQSNLNWSKDLVFTVCEGTSALISKYIKRNGVGLQI